MWNHSLSLSFNLVVVAAHNLALVRLRLWTVLSIGIVASMVLLLLIKPR